MDGQCGNCGSGSACCKTPSPSGLPTGSVVALPSRSRSVRDAAAQPVWVLTNLTTQQRQRQVEGIMSSETPLDVKCGADERSGGQCCKDLKGDDERRLISPEIVRDVIIGLSDGLTVPFALTAGLSSLGSSKLVVTGGLAELCAGAISMGLGGYLASQAELDHFHYLRRQTQGRVLRSCAGEMEREVHSILGPLGVKEPLSRLLAQDLRVVEDDVWGQAVEGPEGIMSRREQRRKKGRFKWWNKDEEEAGFKPNEDMGLTAFLLKFGEGLEEVPKSRLYISALTIGISYFVGGLIPLIPYLAHEDAKFGLIISCVVTGVVLFIFGGFKTYFTGATGGWRGYMYGATSTMLVGGVAAGAAYGLVKALGVKE